MPRLRFLLCAVILLLAALPVARGEPNMGADGSRQFWTSDPDGNPIEFHQFTPESKQIVD